MSTLIVGGDRVNAYKDYLLSQGFGPVLSVSPQAASPAALANSVPVEPPALPASPLAPDVAPPTGLGPGPNVLRKSPRSSFSTKPRRPAARETDPASRRSTSDRSWSFPNSSRNIHRTPELCSGIGPLACRPA